MKNISRRWLLKSDALDKLLAKFAIGDVVARSLVKIGYLIDKPDAVVAVCQRHGLFYLILGKHDWTPFIGFGSGVQLTQPTFESLWEETVGRRVEYTQYTKWQSGDLFSLLVYSGSLDGVCLLQSEFPDDNQAMGFTLPSWADGAIEVTSDFRYSDKNLAIHPEAVDPRQPALV